jgi:hypothetical protein
MCWCATCGEGTCVGVLHVVKVHVWLCVTYVMNIYKRVLRTLYKSFVLVEFVIVDVIQRTNRIAVFCHYECANENARMCHYRWDSAHQ